MHVLIDRTSLSLADLEITGDPVGNPTVPFYFPPEGVQLPDFAMRMNYAPPSVWTPGQLLLSATLDSAALGLSVIVRGSSEANLATLKAELEAAVSQFSYEVSVVQGAVTQTWTADPTWPAWGALTFPMASNFMAQAGLSIPVNPIGA